MKNNGFLWKQVKDLKKERDEYKNTCEWQNTEYIKLQKEYEGIIGLYKYAQEYIVGLNATIRTHNVDSAVFYHESVTNLAEERERHEQNLAALNTIIETQNIKLSRDVEIIKNLKN